jgi:hypothetical protein
VWFQIDKLKRLQGVLQLIKEDKLTENCIMITPTPELTCFLSADRVVAQAIACVCVLPSKETVKVISVISLHIIVKY